MARIGESPGSWRVRHDRTSVSLAKVLYERVRELAFRDPSPVRIARQLSASHSVNLSPSTVRHWIIGDRKPHRRNAFMQGPSPTLSYVIGANIGDGCTLVRRGIVKLEVADRDFAEAFNAHMRELFSRGESNTIFVRYRPDRLPMYIVKYSCRQLVEVLRQPLRELLELASAFPREFLRGFFDAEGHVDVGIGKYLTLHVGSENSNRYLLAKVRQLLKALKVASRIERKRRKGTVKTIRGKTFVMRRNSYSATIGKLPDMQRFANEIGFSIKRKNEKLQDALSVIATYEPNLRTTIWKLMYSKTGGEWVRRNSYSSGRVFRQAQEAPS